MKAAVRRAVEALFHLHDSPHRIALAFAIGVWIAFNPLFGVHTLMALALAFALRLSRAAMLIGAFINNPWTVAPLYAGGTLLGCAVLGVPPEGLAAVHWSAGGEALWEALLPFLWPFLIGNLLLGVIAALPAYYVLRRYLERRAKRAQAA